MWAAMPTLYDRQWFGFRLSFTFTGSNCHQDYLGRDSREHGMTASNVSTEVLTAVRLLLSRSHKIMLKTVVRNKISQTNAGFSDTRKPYSQREPTTSCNRL